MNRTHAVDGMENKINWISIYVSFFLISFFLLVSCSLISFRFAFSSHSHLAIMLGIDRTWLRVSMKAPCTSDVKWHGTFHGEMNAQQRKTRERSIAEFVFIINSSTEEAKACKLKYICGQVWNEEAVASGSHWHCFSYEVTQTGLSATLHIYCWPSLDLSIIVNIIIRQRMFKWHHKLADELPNPLSFMT